MAKKLIVTRNMPDDEVEDIERLLRENGIPFYLTPAGNWGISLPAFWVESSDDYPRARRLLDDYEAERQQRVRAEYEAQKRAGTQRTIFDEMREHPLRFLITVAFIGFLLYITLHPFINFLSPATQQTPERILP